MQAVKQWLQQLQFGSIFELIVVVVSSLLCITVHELCHGLAAYALGDDTAKRQNRLTLNPLRHIDPLGLIMMAVAGFGWAKPVVVDLRRFREPKLGMALTALAGPVSNVLLMLLAAVIRVPIMMMTLKSSSSVWGYLLMFTERTLVLSAGLAVFNLFPIPPLDGSKVLFAVLPDRAYSALMRYERFGMILLAGLLFTNVLDVPLMYMRELLIELSNAVSMPVASLLSRYFVL